MRLGIGLGLAKRRARGAASLSAPHVYVSSSRPDDSGDGLSPATAKRTLTAAEALLNGASMTRLGLARGGIWRETLTMTAANSIVTAYGSGALPIISGADPVTDLAQEASGGEQAGGSWVDFDGGSLTGVTPTVNGAGASAAAASTDRHRSGTHSAKLTGNGTDNRVYLTEGYTQGVGTKYLFHAFYLPSAGIKATNAYKGQINSRVYFELSWNGSKVFTTLRLNANGGSEFNVIGNVNGVAAVDQWNTLEIMINATASGGCTAWLNGVQICTSGTVNLSASGWTGLTTFVVGNGGYGNCMVDGGSIYIDDIKVSTAPISAALQSTDAHRWSAALATEPSQVFVDGVRGRRVATAGEVNSYRRWRWASNTLAVYAADAVNPPVVEASVRPYCIDGGGIDDCQYRSIRLERAGETGLLLEGAERVVIQGAEIDGSFVEGIFASDYSAYAGPTIRDSAITDTGGTAIQVNGRVAGTVIQGNTITGFSRLHEDLVGGHARQEWSSAIKVWGAGEDGWVGALSITDNSISDGVPQFAAGDDPHKRGSGIWLDEIVAPTVDWLVAANVVHDAPSSGIFAEKADDGVIEHNLVYDCASYQYRGAIHIEANAAGWDVIENEPGTFPRNCERVIVRHNTAVGGWWTLAVNGTVTAALVNDCEFYDNICVGSANQQLYAAGGGANDGTHGSGNVYHHNCFGPEAANFVVWGTVRSSYDALIAAASGAVQDNNVEADPLFVDAGGDDYALQAGSPCAGAGTGGSNVGRH